MTSRDQAHRPTAEELSLADLRTDRLVHLLAEADWETARSVGRWEPASLSEVGFVHLSAPEQVHLPANALYRGRTDLVALVIDPAGVSDPIRWEPGDPADPTSLRFPHLYGALPTTSVLESFPYVPDDDGSFSAIAL